MNNFGYDKILTFEDIMRIRKTFLTGIFAEVNCELFGWKEDKPEDYRERGHIYLIQEDYENAGNQGSERRKSVKSPNAADSSIY